MSKGFNMNHSQRAGFSDFELPRKFMEKSRKHVLQCASVCLFVGIKPEKKYSASCVGRDVHPLRVITHGQRHTPFLETLLSPRKWQKK